MEEENKKPSLEFLIKKKAPLSPGVYLYKKNNKVIYVGRSVSLRKRALSYLQSKDFKVKELLKEANNITFKKTDNLLEATILETNLIKKYSPKYNVREKDNRSFIYIVIPLSNKKGVPQDFTYPILVRGQELRKQAPQNAEIFGPLFSYGTARKMLFLLRKLFPYCTKEGTNRKKPCFYYQIDLCPGKCIGKISKEEYQKNIENLILFLKGENKKLKEKLSKTQPETLKLLSNIDDISLIDEKEKNRMKGRIEGYDISHFGGKETAGAMVVFENGSFKKSDYRMFKIKSSAPNDDLKAMQETLQRRFNHPEWQFPDLILIDGGRNQVRVAEKVLKQKNLAIPTVGIAKFKKDKLVFGKSINSRLKKLIEASFDNLKEIQAESHRFSNQYRKKMLKKKIQNNV